METPSLMVGKLQQAMFSTTDRFRDLCGHGMRIRHSHSGSFSKRKGICQNKTSTNNQITIEIMNIKRTMGHTPQKSETMVLKNGYTNLYPTRATLFNRG